MKNKFKFLATMLIGVLLSTNVWGDQISLNFEGTGTFPYNSDWTVTNGSAYTGRTRDNVATTSCASSTTQNYQNLTIMYNKKIEGIITSIHYYAAKTSNNSTETNMYLQTSSNKSTWSGAVSGTTYNLAGASKTAWTEVNLTNLNIDLSAGGYIRLYKAGGSTAERLVDDITITYTNTAGPNVSSSESSLAFESVDTESNKALTTNVSGSSLTENITLSISGTNAGMFSVSPTSLTPTDGTVAATAVTVTYTPTATGSHSATLNIASAGATTKTVSLTGTGVAPKTKHNVNWHVGGEITTVRVAEGDPVEFHADPSVPVSCGEKVFTGWTNAPYEDASVAPTYYKSATMATSDLDFYAVFADVDGGGESWTKVASLADVTEEGIYAIITPDGHAFNGTITSSVGYCTTDAFVFDANNIATSVPTGICELTLTKVDANAHFTMYNSEKGYLYAKDNSSGNLAWHSTENSYWHYDEYNWLYYYNDAYLRTRDNNTVRTYSSAENGDLLIFAKKNSATYSNFVTSCATYNVTWKVNNAPVSGGSTSVPGGGKVSALPTDPTPAGGCAGSIFVGWTDHEVLDGEAPTPLFKTVADAPAVTDDVTYHAVFAEENE